MTPRDPLRDDFDAFQAVSLPDPDVLQPDKRDNLIERIIGSQVSRVVPFADPGPFGGRMVGLLMVDSDRPIFMAIPVPPEMRARFNGVSSSIIPGYFERLRIVTPRMAREYRQERLDHNEITQRIEGEMIVGYEWQDDPNRFGGTTLLLKMTGGRTGGQDFFIRAAGPVEGFAADLVLEVDPGPERTVVYMGGQK